MPELIAIPLVTALGITGTAATVATFVVEAGLTIGANLAMNAILNHPAANDNAAAQDRQASATTLTYGEQPRQAIFGRAAYAGQVLKAFNHGGEYGTDNETLILRLADHECQALEGVWVNDTFVGYTGDGPVAAFNNQLSIYWLSGAAGQALPGYVYDAAPNGGGWDPANVMTGIAGVVITYTADAPDAANPVWNGGRPQLLPVIHGKKCYDPRKDSSVGGSGAHRWSDPSTWEYTENAYICRYNWARGIYALDQVDQPDMLLVGRGLTASQAPPDRAFAPANICDEPIDLGGGDSEPRYRVGGIINAADDNATVEGWFADAMAGTVTQPQGGVDVEPGQSKVPVAELTDADLITGAALEFMEFDTSANRINTVVPTYTDPDQRWQTTSGTPQRDYDDVLADGGPLVETLDISPLVTSQTQAERCAAVRRRLRRLERKAKIVLGPRLSGVEDGDWVALTSAQHTKGQRVLFWVQAFGLGGDWQNALSMNEIEDAVYDEADHFYESPSLEVVLPPDTLALGHVAATAAILSGTDGEAVPGVQFTWDTPVDPGIGMVRAEIRLPDQPATVTATLTDNVSAGTWFVTNGVGANYVVEARLVPVSPGRHIAPSDWVELALGESVASSARRLGDMEAADAIALLNSAVAAGAGLLDSINTLAEGVMAAALQGQTTNRYVDQVTQIDGNTLVSYQKIMGLMDDAKSAIIFNLDKLIIDPVTGETLADRQASIQATVAANSAAIASESSASADAVHAVATDLETVSTTVDGHTASITELLTSTDGLSASLALAVKVDGATGGLVLEGGGGLITIKLIADHVLFASPDGTQTVAPMLFDADTGTFYLTNVYASLVKANVVDTEQLIGGAVTSITADSQSWGGTVTSSAQTFFSTTHTTTVGSAPHVFWINVIASNPGAAAGIVVRFYRDGSEFTGNRPFQAPASFPAVGSFDVFDEPDVGTHTYSLTCELTSGSGSSCEIVSASMIIAELKR